MHTLRELLGLLEIGQLALHPDGIAVRRIRNSAVDSAIAAALQTIIALAGARGIPIEKDVLAAGGSPRRSPRIREALALRLSQVRRNGAFLIRQGRIGIDGVDDGVVEALEPGVAQPGVLDGLEVVAVLAGALAGDHEVAQRGQGRVGAAEDEGVVPRVDGGGDEGGGLGVGARDGEQVAAHDVGLGADGHEPVDVLADGHEHLARHVPALLGPRRLVLDVDPRRAALHEQLRQLHHRRQPAVPRVRVRDDRPQVVDVGELGPLRLAGRAEPLLPLLAVVEELRHEEVLYFVGYGGLFLFVFLYVVNFNCPVLCCR